VKEDPCTTWQKTGVFRICYCFVKPEIMQDSIRLWARFNIGIETTWKPTIVFITYNLIKQCILICNYVHGVIWWSHARCSAALDSIFLPWSNSAFADTTSSHRLPTRPDGSRLRNKYQAKYDSIIWKQCVECDASKFGLWANGACQR